MTTEGKRPQHTNGSALRLLSSAEHPQRTTVAPTGFFHIKLAAGASAAELLRTARIIPYMPRMLTFFLVCLLALRGLAGDAMAMGSLPTGDMAAMVAAPNSRAHGSAPSQAADAHHHAAPTAEAGHKPQPSHGFGEPSQTLAQHNSCDAADDSAPACGKHDQGAPCAACVICHLPASPSALLPAMGEMLSYAQPPGTPARFASAPLLQASKPPIA
jgi:hypothetical protein